MKTTWLGLMALGLHSFMSMGLAQAASTTDVDGKGWYFSVAAGQSKADVERRELDELVVDSFTAAGAVVVSGTSTLDTEDATWSVLAGYRLSPYFAFEGGYRQLANVSYRSSGTIAVPGVAGVLPARADFDVEADGFTLGGLVTLPVGSAFDVHARFGVFFADTEATITASVANTADSGSESASSSNLFYGIGAGLKFSDAWTLSLDYELFKDVGEEDTTGEADLSAIMLSLKYQL
jgi:OmpA-OmpF porin, OOP family